MITNSKKVGILGRIYLPFYCHGGVNVFRRENVVTKETS